jgi:putative ABC transport system ATP-binding protein
MALLTELNEEGQTIVMVTHNPENQAWFHRTVLLRDGLVASDVATAVPLRAAAG